MPGQRIEIDAPVAGKGEIGDSDMGSGEEEELSLFLRLMLADTSSSIWHFRSCGV